MKILTITISRPKKNHTITLILEITKKIKGN